MAARTYKTVSVTFPPALLERAQAVAEREQRSMSELMREAFRAYEQSSGVTEDASETARRIRASLASVRRRDYTDYDEEGLRALGRSILDDIRKKKTAKKRR